MPDAPPVTAATCPWSSPLILPSSSMPTESCEASQRQRRAQSCVSTIAPSRPARGCIGAMRLAPHWHPTFIDLHEAQLAGDALAQLLDQDAALHRFDAARLQVEQLEGAEGDADQAVHGEA